METKPRSFQGWTTDYDIFEGSEFSLRSDIREILSEYHIWLYAKLGQSLRITSKEDEPAKYDRICSDIAKRVIGSAKRNFHYAFGLKKPHFTRKDILNPEALLVALKDQSNAVAKFIAESGDPDLRIINDSCGPDDKTLDALVRVLNVTAEPKRGELWSPSRFAQIQRSETTMALVISNVSPVFLRLRNHFLLADALDGIAYPDIPKGKIHAQDIRDFQSFAEVVLDPENAAEKYVGSRMQKSIAELEQIACGAENPRLKEPILRDLNEIVSGTTIYDSSRFPKLSRPARELVKWGQAGDAVPLLNRVLLSEHERLQIRRPRVFRNYLQHFAELELNKELKKARMREVRTLPIEKQDSFVDTVASPGGAELNSLNWYCFLVAHTKLLSKPESVQSRVMELARMGKSSKQIAQILDMNPKNVRNHRARFKKTVLEETRQLQDFSDGKNIDDESFENLMRNQAPSWLRGLYDPVLLAEAELFLMEAESIIADSGIESASMLIGRTQERGLFCIGADAINFAGGRRKEYGLSFEISDNQFQIVESELIPTSGTNHPTKVNGEVCTRPRRLFTGSMISVKSNFLMFIRTEDFGTLASE